MKQIKEIDIELTREDVNGCKYPCIFEIYTSVFYENEADKMISFRLNALDIQDAMEAVYDFFREKSASVDILRAEKINHKLKHSYRMRAK